MRQFTINAKQTVKREKRDTCFIVSYLEARKTRPSIHRYSISPSAESTRRDKEKEGVTWRHLSCSHPHSHECKRGQKGFKERRRTRPTSVVSPIRRDAIYLTKKIKNGLQKRVTVIGMPSSCEDLWKVGYTLDCNGSD
jgi:hypothetical protein